MDRTGGEERSEERSSIQRVYEALFSLNIGFTGALALFDYAPQRFVFRLYALDNTIRVKVLHSRITTDLASNYYVFFILSILFALCAWTILHIFSNRRRTEVLLSPLAGFIALAALPLMGSLSWARQGYPRAIVFALETILVLYAALRYVRGQWPQSGWVLAAIITLHFGFWSRQFGPYEAIYILLFQREFRVWLKLHLWFTADMLLIPGGAPVALTAAFVSALVWVFYLRRSRQVLAASTP